MPKQTNSDTSGSKSDTSGSDDNQKNQNDDKSTSGDKNQNDDSNASKSNDLVAKIKKEKDNYAKRNNDLQAELDSIKAKQKESQDADLLQKEEFKTLYNQEKERADGLSKEVTANKVQMVEAKKMSSVKLELRKLGLKPEHEKTAFRLMDVSKVVVDQETGVVLNAEDVAKTFHTEFTNLGMFGKAGPGVNHNAPDNSGDGGKSGLSHLKTQADFDKHMKEKHGN